MSRRRKALAAAAAVLIILLICWLMCMRTPAPPRYQPSVGVYQGVDVVALEDFVAAEGGRYTVRITVPGRFVQVPVWGGWSASANITYSTLAVNLTDFTILIFGVASKNATLDQDLGHGFRVHASGQGGYVTYNDTLAGWCLRPAVYDQGAYVWLPASTCTLSVRYRITVEPAWGGVFVNGQPAEVVNVRLVKIQGILPGWIVYANQSGVYYFTVRP